MIIYETPDGNVGCVADGYRPPPGARIIRTIAERWSPKAPANLGRARPPASTITRRGSWTAQHAALHARLYGHAEVDDAAGRRWQLDRDRAAQSSAASREMARLRRRVQERREALRADPLRWGCEFARGR